MDMFYDALLSEKTEKIPDEYDWFAPLIGDWDFDYYDHYENDEPRHVRGEWLFRRVLEGAAVEDLFICPSREERVSNPQPDGEYGVALRIFNPNKKCYDMIYSANAYITRLTFEKENGMLVGTPDYDANARWIFKDITEDTFHWQNITLMKNGVVRIHSNIYAKRK